MADKSASDAVPDPSAFSLLDPKVQDQPFEFYRSLHAHCPVYKLPENDFYVVSKYDDLRTMLRDPGTYSSVMERALLLQGENGRIITDILREKGWEHVATLQRSDPPKHARYRKIVDRALNAEQVRNLAPRLDQIVNELIDKFIDRGECDFVAEFAFPFPGTVVAELIGLEAKDVPRYRAWSENMLSYSTRVLTREELRECAEKEVEMQHFLAGIFEDRRKNPRKDLMTALVTAYEGEEPLTMHELQNIMHQLISGGYETVPSALSHAMWQLIRFPEAMNALRADRSLIKNFIEESIRFESPTQGLYRRTAKDAELGGTKIPAGAYCIARYGAANRDESKFPHADEFDIHRANANQHIAFGFGAHFCPGSVLARGEFQATFNAILDRMDDIELARPLPSPAHKPSMGLMTLKELWIRFRKSAP
jgi:cytochrome P450